MGQTKQLQMDIREKSLYGITSDRLNIENEIMNNDGELTPLLEKDLQENKDLLIEKVTKGYKGWIDKLENEATYFKSRKEYYDNKLKQHNKTIENIKKAIANSMIIYDIDKIETLDVKFSFRKSESIEITCEVDELPSFAKKIKVEPISKTELKRLLKSGTVIEGVKLVENKNLNIK